MLNLWRFITRDEVIYGPGKQTNAIWEEIKTYMLKISFLNKDMYYT